MKSEFLDRETFLQQLPQRITAIDEKWAMLSKGNWNNDTLDDLYTRVLEISNGSSQFGFFQLNESVFSTEVYLSSFVEAKEPPSSEQVEAIDGLLRTLNATATATTAANSNDDSNASGNKPLAYLLDANSESYGTLVKQLEQLGAEVQQFKEPEPCLRAIDTRPPQVIVANTTLLAKMEKISAELLRLKSQMSLSIPLVFVSSSNTLQLRVDAIRAGSDAYYVTSTNTSEIANGIMKLAAPDVTEPYRVMVVEDDPTQAEFAATILQKADIRVETVTEPMRVLDALGNFRPDLILMDIYMPDINGIELTSVIREYNEFVSIPIVFLSGEHNADKQLDALRVGGDDFISKPISPKRLLTIVKNRVSRARQLVNALGSSQTTHDPVSGLFSRRHFYDRVDKALHSNESRTQPAGIQLIRPDRQAELLNTLGAGGMDNILAELGELVIRESDSTDVIAKIDDTTIGLFSRRESNKQITDIADSLVEKIAAYEFLSGGKPIHITASIGLCLFDENLDDADGLTSRAEAACIHAIERGGNRRHIHTTADEVKNNKVQQDNALTASIQRALSENKFVVQYQPMLDLHTRGSENYEIILRMPMPNGDLLNERQIREPAAIAGLSDAIDRWLLERAIAILKERRQSGRRTHIFVRQSGASAMDPNHPAWLLGRLRANQMVGTGLVLDFRLSDLSSDLKMVQKTFRALRDLDVEASISRFPEKNAAFKVLQFLKAQHINIAPRLLKADRDTISKVISNAHKLKAKVIVSNVDDPRSIDLHWSSGADFLQGNFIQRPLEDMDYDFSQVVI